MPFLITRRAGILLLLLASPLAAQAQTGGGTSMPPPPLPGSTQALTQPDVRAQISPQRYTILSSQLAGQITELTLREGDRFKEGQVLVGLDCDIHQARLDRARAAEEAAQRKLSVAGRLDQLSSISRLEVDEAASQVAMLKAEMALNRTMVEHCRIKAPFSGRVAAKYVQRWQYVGEGEKLLEILDDKDLELEMIIPSRWLTWLKPGHPFSLRIDELGRDVPAQITRVGARIDPVSQSVKVYGRISGKDDGLLPGMSGIVNINPAQAGSKAAQEGRGE
ncbi:MULTISPECIES: efflux RND transporter periplasmic adaptor subunit [unclassified Azospirillum]|uniref:efflux RND transporter periplasmic adaptor subunit n=1 Tax=unclassified Azospirillum TaxID=2630922 RepID=UPI000B6D26A5|nr:MULTISPECIES: efflux RND transporter periplasmic adaptor subunit [unclassified Azospirillum]SNS78768.1 RND family efflux transporter, MFP subunit [Azospirillum sp. RU38E]SNS96011.1 RND family efflux transporter, MFP subunit [Azospirillum sp. RU37A]